MAKNVQRLSAGERAEVRARGDALLASWVSSKDDRAL
jgi:hypothetical protein